MSFHCPLDRHLPPAASKARCRLLKLCCSSINPKTSWTHRRSILRNVTQKPVPIFCRFHMISAITWSPPICRAVTSQWTLLPSTPGGSTASGSLSLRSPRHALLGSPQRSGTSSVACGSFCFQEGRKSLEIRYRYQIICNAYFSSTAISCEFQDLSVQVAPSLSTSLYIITVWYILHCT